MAFLESLAPNVSDAAYTALCDISEAGHRAYDESLHRAYCFERQGLEFHYHWWENVRNRDTAEKLFEGSVKTRLPFEDEFSEQVYRTALSEMPLP